jgi:ubiquinone biosynthesis protein
VAAHQLSVGVTFVKLGQVLATRRDVLPPELIDELSKLQDGVAPTPWSEIEAVLDRERTRPVPEVFASIDPEPLAAASIAHVHAAVLTGGEEVAVKIQRPGVGPIVERDLDIVGRLARRLQDTTTGGRTIGVRDLADGFAAALREALDFRVEASNMSAVAGAIAGGGGGTVVVPEPRRELCTARVLVMDRLRGTP